MTRRVPRFDVRWLFEIFALAALYFLMARLGLLMAIPGGHVTPVWPPSGIALAAVLLRGRRIWPGIWLGSFAANVLDFYGSPNSLATELAMSATFGIGASLTATLGGQLLRWFVGERNPLDRVRDVCAFMALGGVVSCLFSATIGVTALCLTSFAPWSAYGQTWLTWWLGDTAGVFIMAPLFLVWGGTRPWMSAARWVELFVGFGLLIAVTYHVFIDTSVLFMGKPLTFVLIPFLVWPAVRFGRRGAATAAGLIALLAVWGTIHGSSPFNLGTRDESLLALELFLSVISLAALSIAVVVTERRQAESDRRRMFDELESRVAERTKSLHQANAALRQLAQVSASSSDYIAVIGPDFRYQFVNDTYLKARGLQLQGMIGRHMREIVGQERFEQLGRPQVETCLRGEEVETFEWTDFRPDFRCFLHVKVAPLREPDGTISGAVMSGRDITARYEAEQAKRESEERFRQLAENINEVFWVWTATPGKARCLYVSPAYAAIWGRSCESLYSSPQSWMEALHPEDRERVMAEGARMDFEQVSDWTYRIVRPNQSIRWIRDRIFPVRDVRGVVVRFAGIAEDITERKLAEEAVRDSEERFRELAENIHEVFWMSDSENTRMIYVSPAYETIWGRPRETLYSSPASWMDAIHPDDKERMVRTRTNRDSASPHDNTYRIVRPDGSVRWIRDRGFPVRDERGVVVRFAGIAEDVTGPKETAEAQERALSLMLATLESTADGILVVNTEGKIVTFNRLFARMWRLSDEVLASKEDARALDCVLGQLKEPEKFLEKVHYLYQHSGEESFDRLIFRDGRVFERYSRPQFIGGRVAGRVWSFRDTTERTQAAKELEEANDQLRLLSRRRIQEQEDERRRLSRELHDQIGQSLTAAKLNVEALRSTTKPALVGRLDETAAILDQLLGQVRQISLDLRPPMLDDLGLVPALRSLVNEQGRRASVAVRFSAEHIPEKLDPEIQITCFRIAQEAITNAVRHANATHLDIALRLARGEKLRLLARDNGIGFDAEATQAQAVDLGLIGIKERAALVGGRAKIISSPRKGTTIDVSLPLAFRPERQARHL